MKKRILSAALCFAMMLTLTARAAAAGSPVILLDGEVLAMDAKPMAMKNTTYVCYWPIVKALYPDATATWEQDRAVIRAKGLNLCIAPGAKYLVANGRYLYCKDGIQVRDGAIMVPVRVLAYALGATVDWEGKTNTVRITSGKGAILSGEQFYEKESLYWLAQIINAESGNQCLEGKIAVGNVVLNRVSDPTFPNSVYAVIFQKGQFTPVANRTIYLTPNEESVIAAKLCLDGANTAGRSLFFVNPRTSPNCWASRNRPYVATIGEHAFFA